MGIKRLTDIRENIENIVKNPVQRGHLTGFKNLDELYTVKRGSYTVWHGAPAHGKSEIIFEVLMNHAVDGEVSAIYSPETGSPEEIMIELAHKYLQKQIVKHHPLNPVASEKEMYEALDWVDYHFLIIDDEENGYSFEMICEEVEKWENENKRKVTQIMAEPYNELVHDMREFNGRQDLYMEHFLTVVRRYCRTRKKHLHLSFHTGEQKLKTEGKISFYPMPKAREAAGGQAGLRKAMAWINIWRPPTGLKNDKGVPYAANEVLVQVEKAKPKYVCYRGTCSLFFDPNKNRYYEKINGYDCYAFDHINRKDDLIPDPMIVQAALDLTPNRNTNQNDDDSLPF